LISERESLDGKSWPRDRMIAYLGVGLLLALIGFAIAHSANKGAATEKAAIDRIAPSRNEP
jgi:hypothetical protein